MPAAQTEEEKSLIEQQAIDALSHLSDSDQAKVLAYIESLLNLAAVKNDQRSVTQS